MHKKYQTYLFQFFLFLATLASTTLIGANYLGTPADKDAWSLYLKGLNYSIPFLGILTIHEFGHYITARVYKVKVSLPYYIPFPSIIGTMGAFIRIKSFLRTTKEIFDIGIAGPLAGFIATVLILWYGFTHLPPQEYIYNFHPDYEQYGSNYADHVYKQPPSDSVMMLKTGSNLLFMFFEKYVVEDKSLIPNEYELIHYPYLFAGFLALFFTALNLLPIGQLDGGHILYGLFGRKHKIISPALFIAFVTIAGLGIFTNPTFVKDFIPISNYENLLIFSAIYLTFLYIVFSKITPNKISNFLIALSVFTIQYLLGIMFPQFKSFTGYLVFGLLIGRLLGVHHPPAEIEEELDWKRKVLGWISLIIFIISFSPNPISFD